MQKIRNILLLLFVPAFLFCKDHPIIILDAGHGGKDKGARVKNFEEKRLTLRTAYLVKKRLESLGYRVIMTRTRDIFLPLGTRVAFANQRKSSIFVSIHYNSAKSPVAKGIEIFYYGKGPTDRKGKSKELATKIHDQAIESTKASPRGVKQGNFQVIRETFMPAVLIEAGFITNTEERKNLENQSYLNELAFGIAQGINKYVKS